MERTEARTQVRILNKEGLHARPSQRIVEIANRYDAAVTIRIGTGRADGKSLLEVMMLASPVGTEVDISAVGKDAERVVEALADLVRAGFGEELA